MVDLITLIKNDNCVVKYDCDFNFKWTDDDILNHIIELNCFGNSLTDLPKLPKCIFLNCSRNKIIHLSELPKCEYLYCYDNELTNLPELPNCKLLFCINNYLPFETLNDYEKLWKFKRFYLGLKFFRLFYKKMLQNFANRKYDLHLELKYSPNLNFYKEDPYYKHFKKLQNN